MKNKKKGFTLVELIVVLAILAILAAMLVPALTGYIDKANKQKIVAETRSVVVAAQTIVSEDYAADANSITKSDYTSGIVSEVKALAEVKGEVSAIVVSSTGQVESLTYKNGGHQCDYSKGTTGDNYKVVS